MPRQLRDARSSISAGRDLERNARRREQRPPRCAARRQHQRLGGEPQRHRLTAPGCRRRSPRSASTAAAVSSIERRVTSIIGQLCLAQSRRDAAISSATACRSIYWSSSRCALRPSSRFCRICTMRSGVANRPTTSGCFSRFDLRRQRHARHQRHIAGLDAAIGEIDRGRRLRRPRHADQHDVGLFEIVGLLAVIMHHRVVERIDAPEIFGIERVLGADFVGRFGAEIGLEQVQHRAEDRQAGQAEFAAFASRRSTRSSSSSVYSTMPGNSSISRQHAVELLLGAHQRMHVLDRHHFGVLRRGRARDRDQRLAGRIGNQMQMKIARRVAASMTDRLYNLSMTGEKAMASARGRKNHRRDSGAIRPHPVPSGTNSAERQPGKR